jgi:hypothetical protein
MMGVLYCWWRRFDVLGSYGADMEPPKGMIPFKLTPIGQEQVKSTLRSTLPFIVTGVLLCLCSIIWNGQLAILGVLIMAFSSSSFWKARMLMNTPLAVNLNHPFMETGAAGVSETMILVEGDWKDTGIYRLKLAKDPLGWVLHRIDEGFSIHSRWDTRRSERTLQMWIIIINQAISFNNTINENHDEFEDARERESQSSDLLEREWPEDEEIEVQGPISRIFSSD